MSNAFFILLCTACLTYLTRLIPVYLMKYLKIPPFVERFLNLMPIAALGALLFPAALILIPGHLVACLAGVASASIISWFIPGLLPPVIGSVAITWLIMML